MKTILEYLLNKNTKFHQVSKDVLKLENEIVDLNNSKTYVKFVTWFEEAKKEYNDLTANEQESCIMHFYYDGSIALQINGEDSDNWSDADFKIRGMTFKNAYDEIIKFINEILNKRK